VNLAQGNGTTMLYRDRTLGLASLAVGLAAFLPLAGCGSGGPELGTVQGTVTLDGNPLPDAKIEFQPQGDGSPSYASTDAQGRYELMYGIDKPGAMPGEHVVRISTFRVVSESGEAPREMPERVPPTYNSNSELIREVQAGDNTIDFALEGGLGGPGA
jgi:hypothetical protein